MSLFAGGTFLAGATTVLFGFLQWVEGAYTFMGLSLAIRIVSAIGESAFFSAIYPLITNVSLSAKGFFQNRSCEPNIMSLKAY